MIGLSFLITVGALVPRRDRSSVRNRSRIRLTAALLGLISGLLPYRRTLNPRKSKPSSRVNDARLILVERQAPGRQPVGKPCLDFERPPPSMP